MTRRPTRSSSVVTALPPASHLVSSSSRESASRRTPHRPRRGSFRRRRTSSSAQTVQSLHSSHTPGRHRSCWSAVSCCRKSTYSSICSCTSSHRYGFFLINSGYFAITMNYLIRIYPYYETIIYFINEALVFNFVYSYTYQNYYSKRIYNIYYL